MGIEEEIRAGEAVAAGERVKGLDIPLVDDRHFADRQFALALDEFDLGDKRLALAGISLPVEADRDRRRFFVLGAEAEGAEGRREDEQGEQATHGRQVSGP